MKRVFSTIQAFWPFIKYSLVGVTGTLVDVGSLYLLVEYAGTPVLIATVLSFLLAVLNNFFLNKEWTFQNRSTNYRKLFIKFLIVSCIGLALTVASMALFTQVFGIWYILSKLMTSAIVLTWNFLGNTFWTFRLRPNLLKNGKAPSTTLSIIIPAYNEAKRLPKTLRAINEYLLNKRIKAEIIVVNDGSSDNTVKTVKRYQRSIRNLRLVSYDNNQGKGYAIRKGVEASRGKLLLFADADNSTPIQEYDRLRYAMSRDKADIAIGSRYLKNSNVVIKQPLYRILLGRIGNMLIRLFLVEGFVDTQCGFKLLKHSAAKELFGVQKVHRFGYDMEMLTVAQHLGMTISEVPVSWFNAPDSRVRPIRDALITFKDLFYIKLNLWCGRYLADEIPTKKTAKKSRLFSKSIFRERSLERLA